jgi:4-amino-4-deoxy-L-arabinose transferase-like glycosyltransferase
MRWSRLILITLMILDVWYRAHTFGPDIQKAVGFRLWPASVGASEPLDCDEAAYAYIGHRILNGDAMYRDLTENKPPLGYWLYAITVAIGGYRELAIRVMPIPFVLATLWLVWWVGNRLAGSGAAAGAALTFSLLSTDPYLFGNGANMEHFINFFAAGSLAAFLKGWGPRDRRFLFAAGVFLGAAALVKQVAIAPAPLFALALAFKRSPGVGLPMRSFAQVVGDVAAFASGAVSIILIATSIVVVTGAAWPAFDDIFHYGRALATDTLPEPNAPVGLIRWFTGNADPRGQLPWPFGSTDYLVWWGAGSWPVWLASIPALLYLLLGPRTTSARRLVALWTLAAWAQVVLPGLYWQHYYLLPIVGSALVVAIALSDSIVGSIRPAVGNRGRWLAVCSSVALCAAIAATLVIQCRSYLMVAPEELTIRYKGGRQWVVLRAMGFELAGRSRIWSDPKLYIWGWQSPLLFYGRLDSPTRHFFVDNLLRDQADRDHPLIRPRIDEIVRTLENRPPELVFAGYPPFPALRDFLNAHYLRSRISPGLWVLREGFGRFEVKTLR